MSFSNHLTRATNMIPGLLSARRVLDISQKSQIFEVQTLVDIGVRAAFPTPVSPGTKDV